MVACDCEVCLSSDSRDKRLRSSVLIELEGRSVLIDAGPDFRQQMLRISQQKLDAVLLTHEHVDHMFGLDDIRAFNKVQQSAVDIYAESRVIAALKRVYSYVFSDFRFGGLPEMELHEIEHADFQVAGINFSPIRGMHYKLPVFGFRLGRFAYLTDMNSLDDKEKLKLQGLDVLVLGAVHKQEHISHMNLNQALELIAELQPERAFITHISHHMGLHAQEIKNLPPQVSFAFDGLELNVEC